MTTNRRRTGRQKGRSDIVEVSIPMPRPMRDRLNGRAKKETDANPLGIVITARSLAVEILADGLDRREEARPL